MIINKTQICTSNIIRANPFGGPFAPTGDERFVPTSVIPGLIPMTLGRLSIRDACNCHPEVYMVCLTYCGLKEQVAFLEVRYELLLVGLSTRWEEYLRNKQACCFLLPAGSGLTWWLPSVSHWDGHFSRYDRTIGVLSIHFVCLGSVWLSFASSIYQGYFPSQLVSTSPCDVQGFPLALYF